MVDAQNRESLALVAKFAYFDALDAEDDVIGYHAYGNTVTIEFCAPK